VLSPGVDPTTALLLLAEQSGMASRFQSVSLGQGQAPRAKRMIESGAKEGNWVFLANCHLSLSWMPQLDKLIEDELQVSKDLYVFCTTMSFWQYLSTAFPSVLAQGLMQTLWQFFHCKVFFNFITFW
jgi:hypothetical protein